MSPLDVLLLVLLVAFGVRGWWRGFCRETLGLAGLFGGVLAAAAFGPQLAEVFIARRMLPPELALVAGWAVLFLGTWIVASLLGRIADRVARVLFLGGVNHFAGALFGFAKGAALLGFALLLAEHVVPSLGETVAGSRLGRPLEQIADSVVATGRELGNAPAERRA